MPKRESKKLDTLILGSILPSVVGNQDTLQFSMLGSKGLYYSMHIREWLSIHIVYYSRSEYLVTNEKLSQNRRHFGFFFFSSSFPTFMCGRCVLWDASI